MTAFNQSISPYGPQRVTNHSAILYLFDDSECVDGDIYGGFIPFEGVTLNEADVSEIDATTIDVPVFKGGVHYNRQEVEIPAIPTQWLFTVTFPRGRGLNTRMNKFMTVGSTCTVDGWVIPDCYERCEAWAMRFVNSRLSYLSFGQLIAPNEAGTGVEFTTSLTASDLEIMLGVDASLVYDNDSAFEVRHVAFCDEETCGCVESCQMGYIYEASNDNSAQQVVYFENGIENAPTSTTDIIAGGIVTATENVEQIVCFNGQVIFVIENTTDGSGRIVITSTDLQSVNAVTLPDAVASGSHELIFNNVNKYWYLFGTGNATPGSPTVYRSKNLTTWENVNTTQVYGAAVVVNDVTLDPSTGVFYIVGDNAGAGFLARVEGTAVSDITAKIDGGAPAVPLTAAEIVSSETLVLGDANGQTYEGTCIENAGVRVYANTLLNGGAVLQIAGDIDRYYVIMGDIVYERGVLTSCLYENITSEFPTFTALTPSLFDTSVTFCASNQRPFNSPANDAYVASAEGKVWRVAPCGGF